MAESPEPTAETAAGPIIRWVGGKRNLLPVLRAAMPANFDPSQGRFFEPFFGGGAFFFDLADVIAGRLCVINDINPHTIALYRAVRDDVEGLIAAVSALAVDLDEAEYYRVRELAPSTELERGARALYLNRTSFNGIWRESLSGRYNVPYGKVKRPNVPDVAVLRAAAKRLAGATIRNLGFEDAVELAERGVKAARAGDFVYLDPPYVPLTPTSSFTSYSASGFRERDHDHLAGMIRRLTSRGVHVMLSNSDTPMTRTIYGPAFATPQPDTDQPGGLHAVTARRSVAASGTSRTPVGEVLATNYSALDMVDPAGFRALTAGARRDLRDATAA